ncbi:MAG TPA: DUF6265 family protein [Caulobacteraceae bacterium]|nr:DUF6265 family protein [Caulobacteraceae bacterium]
MLARTAAGALAGLVLACTGAAAAQDIRSLAQGATPAPSTLADLKGMLGDWTAKDGAAGFSAPAGGEVVGHLLLLNGTAVRVQELWLMRAEGGSVLLRQKHYTPELKDREDKDVWGERKLIAHDAGHLYFENLTFVTKGDAMDMLVRIPGANGAAPTMLTFNFTRVK